MLYSSRFMTNESAIFIELKIVFEEIQPLLEIKFSLFHIHTYEPTEGRWANQTNEWKTVFNG